MQLFELLTLRKILPESPQKWVKCLEKFFTKNFDPNLRKKRVKNIEVSITSKKRKTILTDIKLYPKLKGDKCADIAYHIRS